MRHAYNNKQIGGFDVLHSASELILSHFDF